MRSISLVFATLLFSSTFAVAYSSPSGDPFYIDNYAMNEEYYQPITKSEKTCSLGQQAMIYQDWMDSGYYY